MRRKVRVATRGSELALAQTRYIVSLLKKINQDTDYEIITFTTIGDRIRDRPLASFRGMGVFVKEIQSALLSYEADIAVHSLKDVPVERPKELSLVCFPKRENPGDILLTRDGSTLFEIEKGAVIGTSSMRRSVQLQAVRNDFKFKDIRGNLDTRIKRLNEGVYDAIVLAAAGMKRLGKEFPDSSILPYSVCLPAAGQGALALECREDDQNVKNSLSGIDDYETRYAVKSERTFLCEIGGGCTLPVAAYASVCGNSLQLNSLAGDPETGKIVTSSCIGSVNEYQLIGKKCADELRKLADNEGIGGILNE